jgi:hypothetical protein
MTRSYRVVRRTNTGLGGYSEDEYTVHEVYYADDGTLESWIEKAAAPSGNTDKELFDDIIRMISVAEYVGGMNSLRRKHKRRTCFVSQTVIEVATEEEHDRIIDTIFDNELRVFGSYWSPKTGRLEVYSTGPLKGRYSVK